MPLISFDLNPSHDGDQATRPPSYNEDQNAERVTRMIDFAWDIRRPKGRKWKNSEPNLIIRFSPESNSNWKGIFGKKTSPDWRAVVEVKVSNIPRLMRTGVDLSASKVSMGTEFIKLDDWTKPRSIGCGPCWRHTRTIRLLETIKDEYEWDATLVVVSKKPWAIINFEFSWLQADTISVMKAFDWDGKQVYLADRSRPSTNFNTVYNKQAMGGYWPWPKETAQPIVSGSDIQEDERRTQAVPDTLNNPKPTR
jgi:hypothetical protein